MDKIYRESLENHIAITRNNNAYAKAEIENSKRRIEHEFENVRLNTEYIRLGEKMIEEDLKELNSQTSEPLNVIVEDAGE